MLWIEFSRTAIGAVVMLPVGRSLNKGFFTGTGLPSIVDDRVLNCSKPKGNRTFRYLDKA
jgi:hypothetical protein